MDNLFSLKCALANYVLANLVDSILPCLLTQTLKQLRRTRHIPDNDNSVWAPVAPYLVRPHFLQKNNLSLSQPPTLINPSY